MKNYFIEIENRLKKKIKIESIEIIDNSSKHKIINFIILKSCTLHIKFKSLYLSSITRINAQRIIMGVLKDDIKNKIHALEISIEK